MVFIIIKDNKNIRIHGYLWIKFIVDSWYP